MRILVVDDDYVTRTQLKALLSSYGDCDAAPRGDLALALFACAHEESVPYGLVSLDVDMPEMSGQQVAERIRQWEAEHLSYGIDEEVKILMVSAMDDGKNIFSSFRHGCEAYLVKPATTERLAKALADIGIAK